jgi:hypothetical protein
MGKWLDRYREVAQATGSPVLKEPKSALAPTDLAEDREGDWLSAWRHLAQKTDGIDRGDPRYQKIVATLDEADRAYANQNQKAFYAATKVIDSLVGFELDNPVPSLRAGWRVAYRDLNGTLRDGTVMGMDARPTRWSVKLENGIEISAHWIVAVTEIRNGIDVAGWVVKRFGLDGKKEA